MPEFEMILRGTKIPEKRAPLDTLGRFLWSLQSAMEGIAHAILPVPTDSEKRKQFHRDIQLYLKGIRGGESVIAEIGTDTQTNLFPKERATRALKSLDALFGSISAIQNDNEDAGRKSYTSIITRHSDRVHVLGTLRPLWIEKDVEAIFRPKFESPSKEYRIEQHYKTRVDHWLRQEPGIDVGGFTGIITEIKARGDCRYFVMQDERGDSIKCFYESGHEPEILSVFKTPVRVEVELYRKTQRHLIGDFGSVEKIETINFTQEDYAPLKAEIEFPVEYNREEDLWIAEREDLALRLVSDTLQGLRNEFVVLIDYMVDRYLIQGEEKVTPKLKQAISKLSELVDVGRRQSDEHWVITS